MVAAGSSYVSFCALSLFAMPTLFFKLGWKDRLDDGCFEWTVRSVFETG